MSLDTYRTMKPIPWARGEGRRDEIRFGIEASSLKRSFLESKHNRYHASHYRHGGVCEVGVLRSIVGKRGEILTSADDLYRHQQQTLQVFQTDKDVLAREEVGGAHSSVEAFVMRSRAKGLYLVDVNQEGKDV